MMRANCNVRSCFRNEKNRRLASKRAELFRDGRFSQITLLERGEW